MTQWRFWAHAVIAAIVAGVACNPTATQHPLHTSVGIVTTPLIKCPPDMAYVDPPESLLLGRTDPRRNEFAASRGERCAARMIHLRPYCIDKTEVTVAAYRSCITEHVCGEPGVSGVLDYNGSTFVHETANRPPECFGILRAARDALPMTCISHDDAASFCAFQHKRLPTRDEWEFAARGIDDRSFPWGSRPPTANTDIDFGRESAVISDLDATPVGSHTHDASPYGVLDMASGVKEWTDSRVDAPEPMYRLNDGASAQLDPVLVALPTGRERDFYAVVGQSWWDAELLRQFSKTKLLDLSMDDFPPVCFFSRQHALTRSEQIGLRCVSGTTESTND